jgi:hypothetical protein
MRYDASKALDLIPIDLLSTVKLVNISYRCWCDKVYYMPSLTTEKLCPCGRKIAFSRNMKVGILTNDPTVKQQVKAILKKLQAR